MVSDGLYIFTTLRAESWVVPTEAVGGTQLIRELIRRGLFDASLAITASKAQHGLSVGRRRISLAPYNRTAAKPARRGTSPSSAPATSPPSPCCPDPAATQARAAAPSRPPLPRQAAGWHDRGHSTAP